MGFEANTIRGSIATMVVVLSVSCGDASTVREISSGGEDTIGSWPLPELEAMARALEADTIVKDTTLDLFNERHLLRIVGVGQGPFNHDRSYRIQLTGPSGLVLDRLLTKTAFADSLDAGFLDRAGLYALDFDLVRSQSLYFVAYIGVDETDFVERMGFFLTYAGERKGRMVHWVMPDEAEVD